MRKYLILILSFILIPQLCFAYGDILVEAEPQNAEVYLDGKFVGFSPLKLTNVDEGFHKIMVVRPDALPYITKVVVNEGEETLVKATFNIQQPSQPNYATYPQYQPQPLSPQSSYPYPQSAPQYSQYPRPKTKEEIIAEYERQRRRRLERQKVRFRNTVLGAALLNEVFIKHKRTRHNVRKALTGLGILNELLGGLNKK